MIEGCRARKRPVSYASIAGKQPGSVAVARPPMISFRGEVAERLWRRFGLMQKIIDFAFTDIPQRNRKQLDDLRLEPGWLVVKKDETAVAVAKKDAAKKNEECHGRRRRRQDPRRRGEALY